MKIEKWNYKGEEVDIPILDADDIERNDEIDDLEDTMDITQVIDVLGENNEQ